MGEQDVDTLVLDSQPAAAADTTTVGEDRLVSLLGVHVTDVSRARAVELLVDMIRGPCGRSRAVYFVNAHTLNLAASDESYRQALNAADRVFGDGTGVRWAARLQGVRVRANLCGTDLTPQLLRATADQGYRCFLLGGDEALVARAANYAACAFPGWNFVGCHHGHLDERLSAEVVEHINALRPDLLLVGMGNPRQEQWIHTYRRRLAVPLCLAVGGLFHYWAGDLRRTPAWLRWLGAEWFGILCQQPHKARRYLLGNPLFLCRAVRDAWAFRRRRLLTTP
jgi:N-acetylglucosaminyldiphosphoundecaprenol N-acetyl-beta-D-mannosaminyltransferase